MSPLASRRRLALLVGALGIAMGLRAEEPARAEAGLELRRIELEVGGRVTEVVPADVDGDKKKDLLVVRGREVLVYRQAPDGGFSPEPNQRFRFHPSTVLFDVADLDGDGKVEVLLLQADGASAYRVQERAGKPLYGLRPDRLVTTPTLLGRPVEDEVRRKDVLRDLDSDGDLDLVLPRGDGFSICENDGKGAFAAPKLLPAPPRATLHLGQDRISSQLNASWWFPNPNVAQFDAAGPPEVVMVDEGVVRLYQAPKAADAKLGGLPLQAGATYTIPDQRAFSMAVENPFELDFTMPVILRDLDKDGRVDASSTHVGQGVTRVFKNSADPAKAFASPAQSIRAKGVTFISFYVDIDGDGMDDLILPRTDKVGVWSILKALVTRSVPVDALFYFQRPGPAPYGDEPDLVRSFEVPLSISSGGEGGMKFGTTIIATLDGDYDGDGKHDLVYRTGDDELSIYRGQVRGIAESPSAKVEIQSVDDYRFVLPQVDDLDGDGRSELVLRYLSWDRKKDRITVLRAR